MRLSEIMTKQVEVVSPDESAERAWDRMRERHIHHLVVLDRQGIVGVVSDRDLAGPNGQLLRQGWIVSDAMTPSPVLARPSTSVREAANLLRGRAIGCLPIVEDGKLLGIVTVSDLLELLGKSYKPRRAVLVRRGFRVKRA